MSRPAPLLPGDRIKVAPLEATAGFTGNLPFPLFPNPSTMLPEDHRKNLLLTVTVHGYTDTIFDAWKFHKKKMRWGMT